MKRMGLILSIIAILGVLGAGVVYFQAAGTGDNGGGAAASGRDDGGTGGGSDDGEAGIEEAEAEDPTNGKEGDGATAIPVTVVGAARGSVSTYITATANLVPENEVTVIAETEGRVTRLLVEEGDRVQAGQLLAGLLRDEAQILYEKAEVKAANTEMVYERALRMSGQNLISREAFDEAALEHKIAQQELAEARWRLDKTEIRAPFDGRVTRREITLGQHVRPGDELLVVTSFDPLIARIYLPESDVLTLDEGRGVDITLKADESVRFKGRIQMISPVVDTTTGTVKVTVEAIRPPDVVRPGGFVIVEVVRETRADTVILPRDAVLRELKNAHVFVVENDVAARREVELGLEEKTELEILSGVEAGEQVVIAGQGGLKDGARVKILPEDELARASNDRSEDSATQS